MMLEVLLNLKMTFFELNEVIKEFGFSDPLEEKDLGEILEEEELIVSFRNKKFQVWFNIIDDKKNGEDTIIELSKVQELYCLNKHL